jgi:chemotaxis signal transduction protein
MNWVRSIQRADQLKGDSGANGLVGVLPSHEGNIPVYGLANRLGKETRMINSQGRIVVLNPLPTPNHQPRPWGLLVDRVSQVTQISANQLIPMPIVSAQSLSHFFRGIIQLGEEIILFLIPEQLHPDTPTHTMDTQGHETAAMPAPSRPKNETHSTATPNKQNPQHEKQILVFSTTEPTPGEHALSFALSITQVPEILNAMPMTRVPGAPSFVLGLVNWRNRPVPIIDLNARLGLPNSRFTSQERTRLLIVRSQNPSGVDLFAGLIIHPRVRAARLPLASKPYQSNLPIARHLLSGIVDLEKETIAIPNIPQILEF